MILFLDFDGVLHPDPCYDAGQLFVHAPKLAATLEPFAQLRVVLSTSWRSSKELALLLEPLPASLGQRVVGVTPNVSSFSPPPKLRPYRRQAECTRWLELNGGVDQDWLAIDDRPAWFVPHCEQLIVCHSQRGFNDEAAGRLHAALTTAALRAAMRERDARV